MYEIGIFYSGKASSVIGPPTSMRNLGVLLSKQYKVYLSPNLLPKPVRSVNLSLKETKKKRSYLDLSSLSSILKRSKIFFELANFFYYLIFNLRVMFFMIKNPTAKIIITETGLLLTFFKCCAKRVIYIRRANIDWGISPISTKSSVVKKAFEVFFYQSYLPRVVYLVPQDISSISYSVIPNHFSLFWDLSFDNKTNNKLYYVGTWSKRKGAHIYYELASKLTGYVTPIVYGALGGENELNTLICNGDNVIEYRGVVSKPYLDMSVGDIYISTSLEEGFQRSLVEAMISGCIIVAYNRPDSNFVSFSEGVFLIENTGKIDEFKALIENIYKMTYEERKILGLCNRDAARNLFSEDKILEKWNSLLND